jgi:hypothetical protein
MKNNLCTVRTSYSFYKETAENPLSIKEYTSIVYGFFKFLLKDLFLAREVKIPCKLGSFQIIGKKKKPTIGEDGKIKGLSPDWKQTNILWEKCKECKDNKQLVYHLNEHTSGVRYKFLWKKENILIENKNLYYFKPARAVKRELAKLIKQGKEFYVV